MTALPVEDDVTVSTACARFKHWCCVMRCQGLCHWSYLKLGYAAAAAPCVLAVVPDLPDLEGAMPDLAALCG